jgi:DNA-binding PadR family transcriptional regulator
VHQYWAFTNDNRENVVTKTTKLNTTGYSLLGLIGKRPSSAYDLTKFLERSMLKYILPRSPSQLYNEPKKLATQGLITAQTEERQGRERTVYYITPEGEQVFDQWLKQPSKPQKPEYKALLKFYLTNTANKQEALEQVKEIQQQTLKNIRDSHAQISRFTSAGVPLKEIAMNAAMASRFTVGQFRAQLLWLKEAQRQLEGLDGSEDPETWAIDVYQQTQQELLELLEEYEA